MPKKRKLNEAEAEMMATITAEAGAIAPDLAAVKTRPSSGKGRAATPVARGAGVEADAAEELVDTAYGRMTPSAYAAIEQLIAAREKALADNVQIRRQQMVQRNNLVRMRHSLEQSKQKERLAKEKLRAERRRAKQRMVQLDEAFRGQIDNRGSKLVYVKWCVNEEGVSGAAPLFATVQLRNMKGEKHDIHGEGMCLNADQFFRFLTFVPDCLAALDRMGVPVPRHLRQMMDHLQRGAGLEAGMYTPAGAGRGAGAGAGMGAGGGASSQGSTSSSSSSSSW